MRACDNFHFKIQTVSRAGGSCKYLEGQVVCNSQKLMGQPIINPPKNGRAAALLAPLVLPALFWKHTEKIRK